MAYFTIGEGCTADHFIAQRFIVNIALCGFGEQGIGDEECKDSVRYDPEAYTDSYFLINSFKAYCKANENCVVDTSCTSFG